MALMLTLQSTAFASAFTAPLVPPVQVAVTRLGPRPFMFGGSTKAKPAKAPTKTPAKKAPAKKAPVAKVAAKKAPVKTAAKKPTVQKAKFQKPSGGAFAYDLPGNFNVVGGGEARFDPYNFLKGKSKLEVYRYRECELTHGRVGMLAALGFIVQEKFHPLFDGVGGPAIDQIPQLPFWLWATMGFGITFCEFYRIQVAFRELDGRSLKAETALRPGYQPGQIGFDPLGLAPSDPAEFRLMQEKELAHARIAMIAAAIFLLQEGITGKTWGTAWGAPDF